MRLDGLMAATLLVGGCCAACSGVPDATVVVDLAHAQIGQPQGREGMKYVIDPTAALKVDARAFDFSQSLFPNVRPNAIQLAISKDRSYTAPWDPSGVTTLSVSSLEPINDSVPLDGLRPGDEAILAIGEQRVDRAKNEIVLKTLWAGIIEIRK